MRTLPEVLNGALQPNEAVLLCKDCAQQQTFQSQTGSYVSGDSKDTGSAIQGRDTGSIKDSRSTQSDRALKLVKRLLDPEDLGYVANAELRDCAREVLGLERVEVKSK